MASVSHPRRLLVTSALPYANGPLHLGHILEAIQTDIWARFQRTRQNECYYVCAQDAHGAAIMLKAEDQGISPDELIKTVYQAHRHDYDGFLIQFDQFHTTHSDENKALSESVYTRLQTEDAIQVRQVTQLYDPDKGMFLADRFVKGTCPKCGAADQYGDNCEVCSATYVANELINPRSTISGATPIEKTSKHYFFDPPRYQAWLKAWVNSGSVATAVANKLNEWLDAGLKSWDISRDAPYFGFLIPGTHDKYFYVWLDAPIGYMASFKALCDQQGLDFESFWSVNSECELHHFIGKDIVNFHGLFWPAMLHAINQRPPTALHVHGFLTINNEKMSKSRGTFVLACDYLEQLNPEYLRYYFASKLGNGVDDTNLDWSDFIQKVNTDLINKLVNIASRCSKFIEKDHKGQLAPMLDDQALWDECIAMLAPVADFYETTDYAKAMRVIMQTCDVVNRYIDAQAPWQLAKQANQAVKVQAVCSQGINLFRLLISRLSPVLPITHANVGTWLNASIEWQEANTPLLSHTVGAYQPLLQRVNLKQCQALMPNASSSSNANPPKTAPAPEKNALEKTTSLNVFKQIDLRVAKIIDAQAVEKADTLLRLTVDLGDLGQRQILSGIKAAYAPETLIGKMTVVVANLAPKKMTFGTSQGMVLAAGPGGKSLWLLAPDSGAEPGMRIT